MKPKVVGFTVVIWMKGGKARLSGYGLCTRARYSGLLDGGRGGADTLTYVWNNNSGPTWNWKSLIKIPKDTWALVTIAIEQSKATAYAYTVATKKLELAENKIKHLEQSDSTLSLTRTTVVDLASIKGC